MKILIPTKSTVENNIINSINNQMIPASIEIINCDYSEEPQHRMQVIKAKEQLRQYALTLTDDYIVFHDSDILNLFNDNLISMHKFLKLHTDYGAISLHRGFRINTHICNSVMMIRKNALSSLRFDLFPTFPTCISTNVSLKRSGFKYGYVDSIIRIKHCKKL